MHFPDAWNSVHSWDPPDDPDFVLDPNGDLYDDLVEGDVMEELPSPDKPSKQKQSRVSVSFITLQWIEWADKYFYVLQKQPHVVWMELH